MRWRVRSSGAQSDSRSNSTASSGLSASGRMRPVAAPHHALGRGRDIGARDGAGLRIVRRPADHVGARELHPGAPAVEHPPDDANAGSSDAVASAGRDDRTRSCPAAAATGRRRRRSGRRADGSAHASRAARRASPAARSCRCVVAAVLGSNWVKRMPRMPPSRKLCKLGVGHGRMHHRDAARLRAELRQRVERHRVVGDVGRRRHHDGPAGADALLEQPVFLDARRSAACARPGRDGGNRSPS